MLISILLALMELISLVQAVIPLHRLIRDVMLQNAYRSPRTYEWAVQMLNKQRSVQYIGICLTSSISLYLVNSCLRNIITSSVAYRCLIDRYLACICTMSCIFINHWCYSYWYKRYRQKDGTKCCFKHLLFLIKVHQRVISY